MQQEFLIDSELLMSTLKPAQYAIDIGKRPVHTHNLCARSYIDNQMRAYNSTSYLRNKMAAHMMQLVRGRKMCILHELIRLLSNLFKVSQGSEKPDPIRIAHARWKI